ncbi:cobalt ECF transporter T component CbiQ [Pseudodesulfovibrio sp. JC047]|uniref:cobalt ECF transporter T component CbiQ n=1 Tax=Pseudodesulfovibrio sp. JC047 TaxID=2683199 RepID=UPI0013D584D4|nr:cobalt ECF transporter T component CbiQ [Pseudodesulfovibrio sp. JC047]NDV19808.1 cobalt ECF transporter T component CbiQ [Pseudodesulfovibrio sp. JC047]
MAAITEQFAIGNSFIHRMDPRIRLICGALITIPLAILHTRLPALFGLGFGVLLVVMAQLHLGRVVKRLMVVNAFILFLWFFLPFSLPGDTIWSIGPLHATTQGVNLALLITIKSNAIVLTLMALMGTISVQNLGPALQQLGLPQKLCHLLLFTYRYIFVIHQEYMTMRTAMQARGFKPKTNTHTYRSYAWLVGMILVKSWDRAERVQGAMRCRGFRGRFYSLTTFTTTPTAYVFLFLCILFTARIIQLEFFPGVIP